MNSKLILSLCSLLPLASAALGQPNPVGVFAEVSQTSVTEGSSFNITVRANATQTFDYTVRVAFDLYDAPGHAGPNDLGGAVVSSVTIRANQLSATPLNVTALADGLYEGNETFEFRINADTLTFPAYRPISPTNVFITILDADAAPQIFFSTTTASVTEDNVTVPVSVLLLPRSQAEVRVDWAIAPSPLTTATYGADFSMLAGGQSGTLVLRPKEAPTYVELAVIDSGPGIAPEVLPRIFEPFFTTKHRGATRGTGLGLSTVYTMSEQDGLGIAVETQPGQGARFHIFIPVAAEVRT